MTSPATLPAPPATAAELEEAALLPYAMAGFLEPTVVHCSNPLEGAAVAMALSTVDDHEFADQLSPAVHDPDPLQTELAEVVHRDLVRFVEATVRRFTTFESFREFPRGLGHGNWGLIFARLGEATKAWEVSDRLAVNVAETVERQAGVYAFLPGSHLHDPAVLYPQPLEAEIDAATKRHFGSWSTGVDYESREYGFETLRNFGPCWLLEHYAVITPAPLDFQRDPLGNLFAVWPDGWAVRS